MLLSFPASDRKSGFTLIELMISIAILGLLAAAAIPAYQKNIQKSKMAEGYLFLRKMHDGAVVNASVAYETAIDKDDGKFYTCLKQYPFGQIRSYQVGEYGLMSIPPKGKKAIMYFYQNNYYDPVVHYNVSGNIVCTINNTANPKPEDYGFAVENVAPTDQLIPMINPTYFAVSNYPNSTLTQNLINEGKNVAYYDTVKQRFMSSSILVYADLDGDFEPEYDEDEETYSTALLDGSGGSDKISYLMRGIYIDTVTGEIQSTPAIYALNIGE